MARRTITRGPSEAKAPTTRPEYPDDVDLELTPTARSYVWEGALRGASFAGGAALLAWGASRRTKAGAAAAILGVGAAMAGLRWGAPSVARRVYVEKTVRVPVPRPEVFGFWRHLGNLPLFMRHLESVDSLGHGTSRWVARIKPGLRVQWDAEIVEERKNRLIAWRSLQGSDIYNAGIVHFGDDPAGHGTIIHVIIDYRPPVDGMGAAIARLFQPALGRQIRNDLRRFCKLITAMERQSHGASHVRQPLPGDLLPHHAAR